MTLIEFLCNDTPTCFIGLLNDKGLIGFRQCVIKKSIEITSRRVSFNQTFPKLLTDIGPVDKLGIWATYDAVDPTFVLAIPVLDLKVGDRVFISSFTMEQVIMSSLKENLIEDPIH